MLIGSQLHTNSTDWGQVQDVARIMDDGPWASVWVPDHFVPPLAFLDEDGDCLEGWSLLTGIAAVTRSLRMGVLVTGNTYRTPALLAKMAATVDQISGGRLELGIGAAWHVREHEAYGFDFPSVRERSDRLEEATELIRKLFTADGPVDHDGRYYRLVNAPFAPRGAQDPHIPIMVGGNGERRTLRTLARYGDIMNLDEATPAQVVHKIGVLEEHCREIGRDPAEITKTCFFPVALQDDEAKAEHLRGLWDSGKTPEERTRLAIGPADHIIDVIREYEATGVE
ncbi:MAG: TIGR03560 family F420-dependent LLM class oxidoreductase, partial [Dehalococcoidia bacterium]|nr:TIGR03560 family F420-dependent LLM class oxidoreductase [Dehalococcoidia bacterium]